MDIGWSIYMLFLFFMLISLKKKLTIISMSMTEYKYTDEVDNESKYRND